MTQFFLFCTNRGKDDMKRVRTTVDYNEDRDQDADDAADDREQDDNKEEKKKDKKKRKRQKTSSSNPSPSPVKESKKEKTKKILKCGSCKELGHNKNYCPADSGSICKLSDISTAKTFLCIVFDLETTGFSAYKNEIIQFGAKALVWRDGKMVETDFTFDELVKPANHIPSNIVKLTGISDDHVKDARSARDVYESFLEWVKTVKRRTGLESTVICGHNVDFDIKFLYNLIRSQDGAADDFVNTIGFVQDTVSFCRSLDIVCKNYSLKHVYSGMFDSTFPNAHTALGDVMALCRILQTGCYEKSILDDSKLIGISSRNAFSRIEEYYSK